MSRTRSSVRAWVVVTAAALLVGSMAAPAPARDPLRVAAAVGGATGDAVLPGTLLVTFATPAQADAAAAVARAGLPGVPGPLAVLRLHQRVLGVRVPPGAESPAARALASRPGALGVEAERRMAPQRVPDDPGFALQWAHARADAPLGWDVRSDASEVRLAVIDSGMLGTHADLVGNIAEQVSTADGTVVEQGIGVDNDPCELGHGTFVGGIAGARGDNGEGLAGVAWRVALVDLSAVSPQVGCEGLPDSAILRALDYATSGPTGPVDVVNLSFGRPADHCPLAYQAAVEDALAAGVVVVAAAGNGEGSPETAGRPMVPASCDGVISVAATRVNDERAVYSSANPFVDLSAPGGDQQDGTEGMVLSTSRGGYQRQAGTSHAAPYVAGVAALLRAERPELTPEQVESVLESTARDLARPGRDNGTGWGLVQVGAALALAAEGRAVARPASDPPFPRDAGDEPWSPPIVSRVAASLTTTSAAPQAVAVSRALFDDSVAAHAVLARQDDFADALAGSALGAGLGPLLFTPRTGPLATVTRAELHRVLPPGGTVYLLGGPAALPATLEAELQELGFSPRRLSGPGREHTAAVIADEVDKLGLRRSAAVLLARGDQWPDAVAGGSLAAWFGTPILLTPPTALHPATAQALARLRPPTLYALGGSAAIAPEVLQQAGEAGQVAKTARKRLSGATRSETAVAIAGELERLLRTHGDDPPGYVLAVNVRRDDGFAHALSASAISGAHAAVMVPVENSAGTVLSESARDYVRGFGTDGLAIGGRDLVAESTMDLLASLLRG